MMARWKSPFADGIASSVADLPAAARLAEDHHGVGIAAELVRCCPHPLERVHDVEHADVAGLRELRPPRLDEVREAQHVEAVVDRHHHHVAAAGEVGAVGDRATSPSR